MEVVLAIVAPTLGFGLFALLALRFGAESRPGFDERPVRDDRPNWFPIPGAAPRVEPSGRADGGHPERPVRTPAPRPAPAPAALAPARAAVRRPAPGEA
jgi:hypothetical protein